ncbi:MAG: hypothetical protein ACOVNU_08085 [Candidatus Kapaibacteriota bacterium]
MKKRPNRAILINVEERTLSYVTVSHFTDIYTHIANGCDTFECPVSLFNNDTIYCDGEGRLKDFVGGFMMDNWSYAIFGNGLILGTDSEGDSVDCLTTIEEIESKIKFV